MRLEDLIARYGLIAICLGSGIEGEPFALAGGVLAHRRWLSPYAVMAAAIAGSFLVDQFWFHLARNAQRSRVVRSIVGRAAFRRALGLIERHPARFVLLFRFAYGLRAITAVAVGSSRMPAGRFVALNIVAATIWGSLFSLLGYALGPVLEQAAARYGLGATVLALAGSIAVVALVLRYSRR